MGRTRSTCTRRWLAAGPIVAALTLTACGGADSDDAAEGAADSAAATLAPDAEAPRVNAPDIPVEETIEEARSDVVGPAVTGLVVRAGAMHLAADAAPAPAAVASAFNVRPRWDLEALR